MAADSAGRGTKLFPVRFTTTFINEKANRIQELPNAGRSRALLPWAASCRKIRTARMKMLRRTRGGTRAWQRNGCIDSKLKLVGWAIVVDGDRYVCEARCVKGFAVADTASATLSGSVESEASACCFCQARAPGYFS